MPPPARGWRPAESNAAAANAERLSTRTGCKTEVQRRIRPSTPAEAIAAWHPWRAAMLSTAPLWACCARST
eukprot:scaffold100774_cov30-Tisochrysis_lutea.AAC.2